MDSTNQEELRHWVLEQTAYLDPPPRWEPDPAEALLRMHDRMRANLWRTNWPRRLAWLAAAALLMPVVLLSPAGHGIAQLWQSLTVRQVAIIRVNPWPEGVPAPEIKPVRITIPPLPARDVEDARWRVRYEPRLPRWGILSGSPRLSTTFGVAAGTTIKTADLELALHTVGVIDQTVPAQWDGAQLALHSSALVIAEWPDVVLVQSLPLTLTAPPGFDFPAFSALILRILGVQPEEARQLAERTGTTPPWLVPIGRDVLRRRATIEEITLNSGPATLLREDYTANPEITILWMVPDRVYLLNGHISRELAIATANAVQ